MQHRSILLLLISLASAAAQFHPQHHGRHLSSSKRSGPEDICKAYAFQGPKNGATPPEGTEEGCQLRCAKEKRCVAMSYNAKGSSCRQCEKIENAKDKEDWKTTAKSMFVVSYTFPPTDTTEFVHGLCVMGAKEFTAYDKDTNGKDTTLGYKLLNEPFGNGVKLWADRPYVASGVRGSEMCQGGMYLQPTHHKGIARKTNIQVVAKPLDGYKVTVCAFVEDQHLERDGQWDVELPKNGFQVSSKPFGWDPAKNGFSISYCKDVTGKETWTKPASTRRYADNELVCAQGTGDPHMVTFDGIKYDCQGEGDHIMSKSLNSPFEYQARFEKVPTLSVTTTQGAVIKTGFAGEPVVEVSFTKQCQLTYYIDGKVVNLEADPNTGTDKLTFYPKGLDRNFIFASGVSLKVTFRKWRGDCLLNTYLCMPGTLAKENIVGILGSPDNLRQNDFMKRDGSAFTPTPNSRKEKTEYCATTWCVPSRETSLFVNPGSTCSGTPPVVLDLDDIIDKAPIAIKEACGDNDACIIDTIAADGDITEGLRTLEDENEVDPKPPTKEEIEAFPAPPKELLLPETLAPTKATTGAPTKAPTNSPTKAATNAPTNAPTDPPTKAPTTAPSKLTTETVSSRQAGPESSEKKGSSSGDPHFKTWTGAKYDYHGECDLVLVDNPTFSNGLGLRVHIRTTRVKYFSFIEKVAVQIGNDTLEFDNDVENFYINGKHVGENLIHHKTMLSGFVVRRDPKALSIRLQDEGTAEAREAGRVAKIDLHTRKNGFPAVIIDAGKTDIFEGSLGLLGEFGSGRTLARDGKSEIEIDPINAQEFALEWQVRDTEPSLFVESRYPQFPQECIPPEKMIQGRLGMAKAMEEAKEACAHWKVDVEDCIFDVMATRDVLVAEEGHIVHVE